MRILITCLIIFLAYFTDGQNLVPNPGFEEYTKCPDQISELGRAKYWKSATKGTPDYYCTCASNNGGYADAGVPLNKMGKQQPKQGNAYAGFIALGVWSDDTEREYIQTRFIKPLKEGRKYCIQFYVCLAQNSGVASDAIGALISEKAVSSKKWERLKYSPQVGNANGIIGDTGEWIRIKGTYFANGNEQYITIGNFRRAAFVHTKVIPHRRGGYSYYYIDDITVIDVTDSSEYENEVSGLNVEDTIEEKKDSIALDSSIILKNVFFDIDKAVLLPASYPELNKLIAYLTSRPNYTVEISGHTDSTSNESHNLKLSQARAQSVTEYLVAKGIDEKRVSFKGYGSTHPIASNSTPEGRQENRRVEFKLTSADK